VTRKRKFKLSIKEAEKKIKELEEFIRMMKGLLHDTPFPKRDGTFGRMIDFYSREQWESFMYEFEELEPNLFNIRGDVSSIPKIEGV